MLVCRESSRESERRDFSSSEARVDTSVGYRVSWNPVVCWKGVFSAVVSELVSHHWEAFSPFLDFQIGTQPRGLLSPTPLLN